MLDLNHLVGCWLIGCWLIVSQLVDHLFFCLLLVALMVRWECDRGLGLRSNPDVAAVSVTDW